MLPAPPGVVRFGPFELDPLKVELRKHGVRLRIQDQPFLTLMTLLENPGETVSREQLVKRVWSSGTFVDFEHSLNAAVNRLRQVLGDSSETPRYIETVARRGYRFIGQVDRQTPVSGTAAQNGSSAVEPLREGSTNHNAGLQSLAVLPFRNLSHDHNDDYFSDGLAVEIINGLTKIPGLRVIGGVPPPCSGIGRCC
jgi:DNA-binding winged helix-turn-helix (wHTH) protein